MNQLNLKLCGDIVDQNYINLASNSLHARENLLKVLLSQRALPETGFDDLTIEYLLNLFAMMDTNNFIHKVGVGERESRIYSTLISRRHYNMGHGIGRSGDISATQPKAAGSSLIVKLSKHLAKDALKVAGYQINELIIMPLATGMALTMCLLALKSQKPNAKYVLWPRIDQKTCLKCIQTANLIPIVIENIIIGDVVTTDLIALKAKMIELGADNILCVLTTTSCFAPRIPDNIPEIANICKEQAIAQVINNAYGVQCTKIANAINLGFAKGRIDLIVSSTDKNFMVPVGGAIIYGNDKKLLKLVSELYPGRASAGPVLDLFVTLLSMGRNGFERLLKERKENYEYFKQELIKQGRRVLETKQNSISIGIELKEKQQLEQLGQNELTEVGAMLFCKKVMGARVVTNSKPKNVCGIEFKNYGSHCDTYQCAYITVACAIGITRSEIDRFLVKFKEIYE